MVTVYFLSNEDNSIANVVFLQDRDTIASCVTFVRVIAKCHEITRDFVPDGFLHNCWTTLVTLLRETHNGDDVMSMGREASSDVTRDGLSTEMQGEIKETLAVIIGTLSFSEFSQIVYNLVDRLVSNQF